MTDRDRSLPNRFVVGDWNIDGDGLTASKGRTTNQLEPRGFQVLRFLAERPGRTVTIDELMDQLWSGAVVTPNAVSRVIAHLRKALEDDARNPHTIETVSRTGYRCVAAVGLVSDRSFPGVERPLALPQRLQPRYYSQQFSFSSASRVRCRRWQCCPLRI